MNGYENINRVCGFYVSSMHLVTMLLPFIRKQLGLNIGISIFSENNLKENAEIVTSKLMVENNNITKLDWTDKNGYKYSEIDMELKNILGKNKEVNIFITGNEKYIKAVNENINKFLIKNSKKIKNKYVTIINCYEVSQFNDNIKEILDTHNMILNTSGIHKISEVFEGFKKVGNNN